MQSVFRSTFVGVLALAALTACGDKNATTPGTVQSIQVSPQSATVNVGSTFTFVANVTATGNAARTVTWSTGDATIATVDANGVVTGVKGGNTSVIATSTADPNVKGAASITVGALVSPTVTINTPTHTVPGTGEVPVDLNNVAGQINVTVNVDAGSQKISTVSLIMSCGGKDTTVQTEVVSAGDLAPLGADAASSPLQFSFNTAAFNPTTGAVAFKNGVCSIKASGVTDAGTIVASNSEQLTLNNADFVNVGSLTTTPSTGQVATASDASGLVWHAGAVAVTAVPVIYSSRTITSATINLVNVDSIAQVARGGASTVASGGIVATVANITPASGVITASFPNSTSNATGVGKASVGGLSASVTTIDNTGNNGPIGTATTTNSIRLDNLAPDIASTAPTFIPNTQNSQAGWVGSNFVFSVGAGSLTLGSAANDISSAAAGSVAGVDNVVDTTQFAVGSSSTFTTFSKVSDLTETNSGSANSLRLKICDALGNCVNTGSLGTFGVDLTAPGLVPIAGGAPTNLQVFNIDSTFPANISFDVRDSTLTVGGTASGASPTTDLLVSVVGLHPSGAASSATTCDIGTSTGTAPAQTCKAPQALAGTFASPAAITAAGEYTMTITGVDQAGNQSAPVTIKYYIDQAAPVVAGGVAVPASITVGTAFTSTATDNMDVAAGNGFLSYPTSAGLSTAYNFVETGTATPTGVTFDNALVRSSSITLTLNTFYRTLEDVLGTIGSAPLTAGVRALDAAGNVATNQAVALPPSNIAAGTAFSNTSTSNGITSWAVTASVNPVDSLKATVLTATAQAFNLTSASPFNQVCFYYQAPTGSEGGTAGPGGSVAGELVQIGCSTVETTTLSGGNRFLNYTVSWTPPLSFGNAANANVFAVGSNGAGQDGLITARLAVTVNQ